MAESQGPSDSSCRDSRETLEVDRTVTPRTYILCNNITATMYKHRYIVESELNFLCMSGIVAYIIYDCSMFSGYPGAFCVTLEHSYRFLQFVFVIYSFYRSVVSMFYDTTDYTF